jgi:hypothetical protein
VCRPSENSEKTPGDQRAVTGLAYGDTDPFGSRDVAHHREAAEHHLREYAKALRYWNAPDDEHTCIQLRALIEAVIEETFRV